MDISTREQVAKLTGLVASVVSWVILVGALYLAGGLAVLRFRTASKLEGTPTLLAPVALLVENFMPTEKLATMEKVEVQSRLIELMLVVIAIAISLVPAIWLPYKLSRFRARQPLRIVRTRTERARNEFIRKRYQAAEQVTVFAGGFGWLLDDEELGRRVIQLARNNAIRFVSHCTRDKIESDLAKNADVRAAVLANLVSRPQASRKIVCSLLEFQTNKSFMYLHKPAYPDGRPEVICEFRDIDEGAYMIAVLGNIVGHDLSAGASPTQGRQAS